MPLRCRSRRPSDDCGGGWERQSRLMAQVEAAVVMTGLAGGTKTRRTAHHRRIHLAISNALGSALTNVSLSCNKVFSVFAEF